MKRLGRILYRMRWILTIACIALIIVSCQVSQDTRQLPRVSGITQSSPSPSTQTTQTVPASQLAEKLFKDSTAAGSRALCAAEHADCPATGELETVKWFHIDAGDNRLSLGWCTVSPFREAARSLATQFRERDPKLFSEWEVAEGQTKAALNAVASKIPADWAKLADEYCTKSARMNAMRVEQEMIDMDIPVGSALLIRGADQWNQRPLAAEFYVKPALKNALSKNSLLGRYQRAVSGGGTDSLNEELEAALRTATIESFREGGTGEYWAGGPIDPSTGQPKWQGLFAICREYSAYDYLKQQYGAVDSTEWKRGCIAHNQNGRSDRIKDQLKRLKAWSFNPN